MVIFSLLYLSVMYTFNGLRIGAKLKIFPTKRCLTLKLGAKQAECDINEQQ